jgi:hypothetical protein
MNLHLIWFPPFMSANNDIASLCLTDFFSREIYCNSVSTHPFYKCYASDFLLVLVHAENHIMNANNDIVYMYVCAVRPLI